LKSTREIFIQRDRIFKALARMGARQAKAADPEYGGSEYTARTWGSEAGKKAWNEIQMKARKVEAIFRKLYDEAEHREHVARGFRPLWCRCCQEKKAKKKARTAGGKKETAIR
jgi:hypothetical protein